MKVKTKLNRLCNYRNFRTLAFIFFWFALFVDATWAFKGGSIFSAEALFYTVASNAAFVVFTVLSILRRNERPKREKRGFKAFIKEYLPLILAMAAAFAVIAHGYSIVQMYDAHLYYGSFITAIDLYDLTLRTAVGAFNLWGKLFIGSAVLVAPLEYLFFKQMMAHISPIPFFLRSRSSYFINTWRTLYRAATAGSEALLYSVSLLCRIPPRWSRIFARIFTFRYTLSGCCTPTERKTI